ncbi:tRNA (adenosine(37)-N6)-threonylcarbamoyltransferase complex dimerization subunit type 1 TsaB [Aliikangiella coralliicola]|uniref:tRNA threonylcarbamoyladenosine biosynthesis protein TsaB n=1 Tax=Aliikangiella coralliicola TaxID=2592383 RepID=A0A545U8I5_9GAMM|nr:tRNA (adenosine(37)-N6)-threonylcarbamoyltransferase complex dimerization subunit type 1 TsaB [Aliikangiella coralliicola]TQV85786.1 tRNA (adenosine(37)-N6)-threonylcarbamoyltransferase complex dimerization subunit type 1 TsaB [Aliikangiella coralliicola]
MTKILVIDSSTEACSVALLNDGEVSERYQLAPREHAKLLLPMVQSLLADAELSLTQLDAIGCNVGPGAFTGIRIAVSVAQGLAFGANLPAISLSSLANLACYGQAESDKKAWFCAIDARMNEVYFSGYKVSDGVATIIGEEMVIPPESINWAELSDKLAADFDDVGLIGSGWLAYEKTMLAAPLCREQLIEERFPRALYGLKQAEQIFLDSQKSDSQESSSQLLEPEFLQPIYLRNNVAKKSTKK